MKKTVLITLLILSLVITGCSGVEDSLTNEDEKEMRRVDLYVTAMKAAFDIENGGDGFIAVRMDTLEGLSDEGKQEVLNRLKDLSENVYPFAEVENDSSKFEKNEMGLVRTLDGALLSINLEEYSENKAVIEATSWFGNLGAVFPKYEAKYKNGEWQLEVLSMAIS